MNKNIKLVLLITAVAVMAAACPSNPVNNAPVNTNSNVNSATPKPAETATPTPAAEVSGEPGSLATPTDAYKTAYAIRQKKDGAALKRVLSKDILEFFTEMGKLEKKSLDEMLKDLAEKPQASTAEVRNEKITGDRAILEYKDEKGEWKEMDFEKEGSEWKLTLPKADDSRSGTGSDTGTGTSPKKP